jgi:hypothetical protein
MELICGACHGRLLAEAPGSTVACPHCGTLLQTPTDAGQGSGGAFFPGPDESAATGPDPSVDTVRLNPWEIPAPRSQPTPPAESFHNRPAEPATGAPGGLSTSASSVDLDVAPPETVPVIRVSETGSVVVTAASTAPPADGDTGHPPGSSVTRLLLETGGAANAAVTGDRGAASADGTSPAAVAAAFGAEVTPASVAGDVIPRAAESAEGQKRRDVERLSPFDDEPAVRSASAGMPALPAEIPRLLFLLVLSYASAMTIACGYLVWTRPSTLDLPDLAPPKSKNKSTTLMQYLPPDKELPPANVMRLGEERRFGSVRVTPLRVTRGPVEFVFYKSDIDESREPEGPLLKLHLRFDNVSRDQEFTPLDRRLVFTKEPDKKEYGLFKANNFVCNVGERAQLGRHVFVYDMSADSEWLIKDQNLDRELKPGESVETFIATTKEQIETLAGDLVWRVQFRKGYNVDSFRGVTTLIEVRFVSSEIKDEEPPPQEPETKEA